MGWLIRRAAAGTILACVWQPLAASEPIKVPGASDMWLAGMPDGTTSSSGDKAPEHSPVLVDLTDADPGCALGFEVSGKVAHGAGQTLSGPDGGRMFSHAPGAMHGLSNVTAPINALLGVFLDADRPDRRPAPPLLSFETREARDFLILSPRLNQIFFIGDGKTSSGLGQIVEVPEGARRIALGTMDGFGWYNNIGAFEVTLLRDNSEDGCDGPISPR